MTQMRPVQMQSSPHCSIQLSLGKIHAHIWNGHECVQNTFLDAFKWLHYPNLQSQWTGTHATDSYAHTAQTTKGPAEYQLLHTTLATNPLPDPHLLAFLDIDNTYSLHWLCTRNQIDPTIGTVARDLWQTSFLTLVHARQHSPHISTHSNSPYSCCSTTDPVPTHNAKILTNCPDFARLHGTPSHSLWPHAWPDPPTDHDGCCPSTTTLEGSSHMQRYKNNSALHSHHGNSYYLDPSGKHTWTRPSTMHLLTDNQSCLLVMPQYRIMATVALLG